jgi:hypothetical protein
MAEVGMDVPTFSAVTSAAVMIFSGAGGSLEPAAATGSAACSDCETAVPTMRPDITSANALVWKPKRQETGMLEFFMMQI